jgi:hypothetical protein
MLNKGGSTNELQIISSHACITGCADVARDGVRSNCNASPYRNPHQSTCPDRHTSPADGHPSPANSHARAADAYTHTTHTDTCNADSHANPADCYTFAADAHRTD